ncbi:DUF6519 domain-containing protein [Rhodovulum sulfidophilum]|uniref:DUF6519 domain-containing protein n=1 Tax=Rhodovulum sulfidophilum TaxID=35806 RepID=UPI0009524F89|nr:DUF6519 domain-containing protein [Rhodovulum sulfidophilum]OLS52120.1 hypothetical protein BV392_09020 [Rhodovulum sulfidophilum]
MSSSSSRYSHQRGRRFSQQILHQGAMVTDADQREGQAIGLRNTVTLGDTSIRTGVPQTGGVVAWEEVEDPSAHKIAAGLQPGKVVADGHVGEVRAVEGADIAEGSVFDLIGQQYDLQDWEELPDEEGPWAVYADLWHRNVGIAEDARLVDPAFLSADTSSRTELMAQVKLAAFEGAAITDDAIRRYVEDEGLPRYGDFRLIDVAFASEVVEPDDCDPCATTLEDPSLDAGNDLFRLEVHASNMNRALFGGDGVLPHPDSELAVTLKWSRDNGSVEVPVARAAQLLDDPAYDGSVFELTWLAAEQRLGVYPEGMTERLATLHNRADIEAALAGAPADALIRVWDGAVEIDLGVGDLAPDPVGALSAEGSIEAEDGGSWVIEIELGGLALTLVAEEVEKLPWVLPGDAWCVEIRKYATAEGDKLIWEPEPVEIEHHYAWLGIVEGGKLRNVDEPDMRSRAFPALTELDALDIHYDNSRSEAEAWTVQGALDLLFAKPPGEAECDCLCTYTIDPDGDLREQLEKIIGEIKEAKIGAALICLPAGRFALSDPVMVDTGVDLTIRGAGRDLTVIELAGIDAAKGVFAFVRLNSVTVEDLAVVGKMKSSEEEMPPAVLWCLDCEAVALRRLSLTVSLNAGDLGHGLQMRTEGEGQAEAPVTVEDCLFRIDAGGQGIGIWRAASSLRLADCEFRSIAVETLGGSKKLGASDSFIARTKGAARTAARERQIVDGLYMPYPGNSEMLLDLTGLDPEERPAAKRYWSMALRMIEGADSVATPRAFEKVKADVALVSKAAGQALAAELSVGEAGAGLPIRKALIGRDGGMPAPILGIARPTGPGMIANPENILITAGSRRGEVTVGEDASRTEKAILKEIEAANAKITGEGKLADWVAAVGPVLDIAVGAAAPEARPTWGGFAFTVRPLEASVSGNTFLDLDVGLDLVALPRKEIAARYAPPIPAVIRDNVIRRVIRMGRVFPPEWAPGLGATLNFGRNPITLANYDDITLENNEISQLRPEDMGDDEYEAIYAAEADEMGSFAGIALRGRCGPKIRGIGNSSFSLKHCILVDCMPSKTQADFKMPMENFWVFRENSALPVMPIKGRDAPVAWWAVELTNNGEEMIGTSVRAVLADNHVPNPKFEK